MKDTYVINGKTYQMLAQNGMGVWMRKGWFGKLYAVTQAEQKLIDQQLVLKRYTGRG